MWKGKKRGRIIKKGRVFWCCRSMIHTIITIKNSTISMPKRRRISMTMSISTWNTLSINWEISTVLTHFTHRKRKDKPIIAHSSNQSSYRLYTQNHKLFIATQLIPSFWTITKDQPFYWTGKLLTTILKATLRSPLTPTFLVPTLNSPSDISHNLHPTSIDRMSWTNYQ